MTNKKVIIAVLDPMCSWCWGFEPVLQELRRNLPQGTDLSICMGGLRSKGEQDWTTEFRSFLKEHWTQVQLKTGQEFNLNFLNKSTFQYDTEPACRAVVSVRNMDKTKVFDFMHALQKAFYQEMQDITCSDIISDIAENNGLNKTIFLELFHSQKIKEETQADKYKARSMGANSFPSLVFIDEEGHLYVLKGYKDFERIKKHLL